MKLVELDEVILSSLDETGVKFHLNNPQLSAVEDTGYSTVLAGWVQSHRQKMLTLVIRETQLQTPYLTYPLKIKGTKQSVLQKIKKVFSVSKEISNQNNEVSGNLLLYYRKIKQIITTAFDIIREREKIFFRIHLNTLGLPTRFGFSLYIKLQGGSFINLVTVKGKRKPLSSLSYHPVLHPLMLISMGRTGTTMTMKMLATHPGIVAQKVHPYESKAASYWMQFLWTLTTPHNKNAVNINEVLKQNFEIGAHPNTVPRFMQTPNVREWLYSKYVEEMAVFVQKNLDGYYKSVAQDQDTELPLYFAEKFSPSKVAWILSEVYPNSKEVFLVRDFRDMVSSMMAFNSKRGFVTFGRQRFEKDEDFIFALGDGEIRHLYNAWKVREHRAYLVKYEDLILDSDKTIRNLLNYLDLDCSKDVVNAMVLSLMPTGQAELYHQTSKSPQNSIGRWKNDLDPHLQRACKESFGDILEYFGYGD